MSLKHLVLAVLVAGALLRPSMAEEPVVKKGDRIAIVGDSITEQMQYSRFIEAYFIACAPQLDVSCVNVGWSGERASGLNGRWDNDIMWWKPTLMTTCYGMNDGSYVAYNDTIGTRYREPLDAAVKGITEAGVRVIVGTPGVVDSDTFKRPTDPAVYNENLAKLSEIAREVATKYDCVSADVNGVMMKAMVAAKAKYGEKYHVAGGDGVHPAANGHLLMAYAFLKAMGVDGNIGTITLPWGKDATASEGHKVTATKEGAIEVESSRYPFTFYGAKEDDPNCTRGILPFVPFNQDLNRFNLVVTDLPTASADVTWGKATKTFTREQLAAGVNLADAFADDNPFMGSFQKILNEVGSKQNYDRLIIKNTIHNFQQIRKEFGDDAEANAALATLTDKMAARETEKIAAIRAMVTPLAHTLTITPKAE